MKTIFGITFSEMKNVNNLFDVVCDCDEQIVYESKKTFHHDDDVLKFDYKYIIDCAYCEGKKYYQLSLAVLPKSCCPKYRNDVKEFVGVYDDDELTLFDTNCYGGSTVMFGCESEDGEDDYNWNDDILNRIASVFEVMDSLRGFYIDRRWNLIGSTGWDTLSHCVNGKELFKI